MFSHHNNRCYAFEETPTLNKDRCAILEIPSRSSTQSRMQWLTSEHLRERDWSIFRRPEAHHCEFRVSLCQHCSTTAWEDRCHGRAAWPRWPSGTGQSMGCQIKTKVRQTEWVVRRLHAQSLTSSVNIIFKSLGTSILKKKIRGKFACPFGQV